MTAIKNTVAYLSGPMSGYKDYNYPTFARVARHLRAQGWEIRSPHENEPEPDGTPEEDIWANMMVKCKKMMEECNAIILMQGWPESRGAKEELKVALDKGWTVYYYDDMLGGSIVRMSGRSK